MPSTRTAFTLVELLVVVTIILVLLALLTPAMDRAIYLAELAGCGARQHAFANGVLTYALDFKRRYPNRPGNREDEDTTSWSPFTLAMGNQSNNPIALRDLRPIISPYAGYKFWNCSFPEQIDLRPEATPGAGRVYASYNMFFGFTYTRKGSWLGTNGAKVAEQGMVKLGDRWTFENTDANNNPVVHQFSVLTCDVDFNTWANYSHGSHPDSDGAMVRWIYRGELGWPTDGTWFGAMFRNTSGVLRGLTDLNASRDDGSVTQYNYVRPRKHVNPGITHVAQMDTRFGFDGQGEWINVPEN